MIPSEPRPPHVLVVEDDADTREVLLEVIESCGIRPVAACDGAQALTLLRGGTAPAAVFLDNWMPKLSGDAVLAAMRVDPALCQIPVVWMSAGTAEPPAGTRPLLKPFGIEDVAAILGSLCKAE